MVPFVQRVAGSPLFLICFPLRLSAGFIGKEGYRMLVFGHYLYSLYLMQHRYQICGVLLQ